MWHLQSLQVGRGKKVSWNWERGLGFEPDAGGLGSRPFSWHYVSFRGSAGLFEHLLACP